jgi:hypothetical protein
MSFRQRSSFASTRNLCVFDRERFFSCEKLLQNDSRMLSLRQRSFLTSPKNFTFQYRNSRIYFQAIHHW